MQKYIIAFMLACAFAMLGCVSAPQEPANKPAGNAPAANGGDAGKKIKIGFSMATVKEERWQRDRAAFEAHCKELNVECVITVADNRADKQANDVDNLLTQGVTVLVIAPQDATQAASMVDKAKAQGVPVISYDRLINSDKLDLYVSHQVPVIGRKIRRICAFESSERQLHNGLRLFDRQQRRHYEEGTVSGFTVRD